MSNKAILELLYMPRGSALRTMSTRPLGLPPRTRPTSIHGGGTILRFETRWGDFVERTMPGAPSNWYELIPPSSPPSPPSPATAQNRRAS